MPSCVFARAHVNGQEVKRAFAADTRLEKLWRYKQDRDGNLLIENGGVAREVVYGKVRLRRISPRGGPAR